MAERLVQIGGLAPRLDVPEGVEPGAPMVDGFGRTIVYLRISVTD